MDTDRNIVADDDDDDTYATTKLFFPSDRSDFAVDFLARHPDVVDLEINELVAIDQNGQPCDQLDITLFNDPTAEFRLCQILSFLCQRYQILLPFTTEVLDVTTVSSDINATDLDDDQEPRDNWIYIHHRMPNMASDSFMLGTRGDCCHCEERSPVVRKRQDEATKQSQLFLDVVNN